MKAFYFTMIILFFEFRCLKCLHLTAENKSRFLMRFERHAYSLNGSFESINIECENHDECEELMEGSKCLNGKCDCPALWVYSSDRTKCLKLSDGLDSPCEEDVQCSGILSSGGVCFNNTCKCKENYHYLKGFCWKSRQLQQTCHKSEQCFSNYDYRGQECRTRTCACRNGYYERFNSSCRKIRDFGESCNIDSDCPEDSICDKMRCAAPSNQIKLMTDMAKESTNDFELEIPGKGSSCPKGQYLLEKKCVLELGMECTKDSDCSHIAKATCTDNVCSCEPVLAIASDNMRKCLQVARGKVADIGKATCKTSIQCSIFGTNSYCAEKKCACKNEAYWDEENHYCWPFKRLGETCKTDKDCDPLNTQAICKEGNGGESSKICICEEGYYAKGLICFPEAKEVGAYCEENADCLFDNSWCDVSNKTCKCVKNFYEENGQCLPGVGTLCETQEQCSHLKNVRCHGKNSTKKICSCNDDHVQAGHLKYCLPTVAYNESCEETIQCQEKTGSLSVCTNGTCSCDGSSHYHFGRCYRSRSLGQSCKAKPECFLNEDTNSTICLNGYCSCHYDYNFENGRCMSKNSAFDMKINTLSILAFVAFLILSE